jgi:hypothetical protein
MALPDFKLKSFACLAMVSILSLHSRPAEAEQIRTKPFACIQTDQELPYLCAPQSPFLGAAVGMRAKDAFDGICTNASDAFWAVNATWGGKPSQLAEGLKCEFWPRFAKSRVWQLRVNGYPCVRTRFILLVVGDDKIADYKVLCHEIIDKSLLVNDPALVLGAPKIR